MVPVAQDDREHLVYHRPLGAVHEDFLASRVYETQVSDALGAPNLTKFESKNDLDIWVPGFYLDVKEKRQHLGHRWHIDGWDENDTFILDEQGYRRALGFFPHSFFLLKDCPNDRIFLAPIWVLACVERVRYMRVKKGKFGVHLSDFPQLKSEADIHQTATSLLLDLPWRKAECVGEREVAQV